MPLFRVALAGICLFVPDRPFSDLADPPQSVTALLPDLTQGAPGPNHQAIPMHYPKPRFNLADHAASPNQAAFDTLGNAGRLILQHQDLRFRPDGAAPTAPLTCSNGQPVDPEIFRAGEGHYLHWLSLLQHLGTGPVPSVDPALLAPVTADQHLID